MTTPTEYASRGWAWLRALPGLVQAAAVVGLLLVVLWLFGGLQLGWAHFRDWLDDRKMTELQQKNDELRIHAATLEGEKIQLEQQVAEKDAELQAAHERAKAEDANIETGKKHVSAARAGRSAHPVRDIPDLDKRLQGLYPDAH